MKYFTYSIYMLILLSLVGSCTKPQYNCDDCIYFRCKVDGKEWRMNCNTQEPFGCSAYDVQYYRFSNQKHLYLYVKNDRADEIIKIRSEQIFSINKNYKLNNGNTKGSQTFFADRTTSKDCSTYDVSFDSTDSLYISEIDTVNYIIAGKFDQFTGIDTCGNKVHVTDGEFRLRYRF